MNNPPAFPKTPFIEIGTPQNGMTLRDYMAAKAMQAMEARNASGTDYSRAIRAYEIADAMLAAREKA